MEKYLLLAILTTSVGICDLSGRPRYSMAIICFLASAALVVFHEQDVLLSTSALLLLSLVPVRVIKSTLGRRSFANDSVPFMIVCVCLFVLGLSVGMLNFGSAYSQFSDQSFEELLSVSMFPIIAAIFIWAAYPLFVAQKNRTLLLKAFVMSVFVQLLVVGLQLAGKSQILPAFAQSSVTLVNEARFGETYRYGGLIGDYELIVDYSMIVIGLSIVLWLETHSRVLPAAAIASSIALALLSGTRSFVVVMGLALLLVGGFSGLLSRTARTRMRIFVGALVIVPALVVGVWFLAPEMLIFQRLDVAITNLQSNAGMRATLNRNFSGAIPLLVENTGVVGAGAFLLPDIRGNEIVSHNLILAFCARYGVVGLVAFLGFVFLVARRFVSAFGRADGDARTVELCVLCAFSIALLTQQMKVSGLRSTAGILVYCIWFAVVFAKTRTPKAVRPSFLVEGSHP